MEDQQLASARKAEARAKLRSLQELVQLTPIAIEGARAFLNRYCNSYDLLPQILEFYALMDHRDWLRLLGENWTRFDNVGKHLLRLRTCLPSETPIREMMSDAELGVYEQLDKLVTVYRGCGEETIDGLCWSLRRDVAEKFPKHRRYKPLGRPVLVTARARKESILAIKLDREEAEVIVSKPTVIITVPLTQL